MSGTRLRHRHEASVYDAGGRDGARICQSRDGQERGGTLLPQTEEDTGFYDSEQGRFEISSLFGIDDQLWMEKNMRQILDEKSERMIYN